MPSNPYLYGIKFGLAGILAVFVSLVLRIEEPGWALITVFVLMVAKFLGAIAEKSVFRVMGTITGGILGYLITGAFQQNPVVFLGLVFVVLAFCTAMFGQNRYPYAFFLCGLTLVVVCANGMGNPDFSWRYALWRTEEVFVGVLSVLLVQSVIFPRFAREAFIGRACAAFGDLEGCFRRSAAILFAGPDREAVARAEGFPERLHALRNLLVFGSRESLAFRSRLGGYLGLVDALTGIAHAISTMDKTLPGDSPYRTRVGGPLEGVIRAVSGSLTRLAGGRMPDPAAMAAMRGERDRAFAALEETLLQMRNDPAVARIPIDDDAMAMGAHLAALETIRSALDATGGHLRALAAAGEQRPATRAIEPSAPAIPSRPWLRNGIKSAAATVTAMVLANWLQPPGATLFILATWIFTAMNPMSPSGRGDLGAWSTVLKSGLALIVYAGFLVIAAPMLASYAALNVVLFAWLFLWGTLSERREGFTVPMQLSLLCAFGVVGINAQQQPVPFQTIAGIFFGLMMALVLATLFSRTFAPNLPQRELRDRLVELTGLCRQLLDGCSLAPWERTRLAILPGECATRLALLRPPCFPAPQTALLGRCTSLLARAGQDLLVHRPARFPEHLLKRGTSIIDRIHTRMRGILDDMQQSFRGNPPGKADDSLRAELRNLRDLAAETRTWMLARGESVAETTRFLGHIACIDRCATTLLEAGKTSGQIHIDALDADHRL